MIHLEHLNRHLAAFWVLSGVVALATGLWPSWALLGALTAYGMVSARWVVAGAGRKPLPLWEYFHWIAADLVDAEDTERERKLSKGRR